MSEFTVKPNGRPTASEVRSWGRKNDFEGKTDAMVAEGTRGRLNPSLVAAFNKGRKGARTYAPAKAVTGTKVTVKPEKGRSKTVTYSPKAARAALAAAGVEVKGKGRLPKAALASLILNG